MASITRKTDKGLPRYLDEQDSDVFVLSGAEDLVPVYRQDAAGAWVRDRQGKLVIHEDLLDGHRVRRYWPRTEGLFARIERWTNFVDASDVHWRSISKDNVLTIYGSAVGSRVLDPGDAAHIFSWLICEVRDDKGNAVLYRYKAEDGVGVDLGRVNERNRGPLDDPRRTSNRYLKRILYGNRSSLLDDAGQRPRVLSEAQTANAGWMFELVFDFGDHDPAAPKPKDDEQRDGAGSLLHPWPYRRDPFSIYRSGFEVRTSRLCRRVLMFHHFPGEAEVGGDCLVRSTDLDYADTQGAADERKPVYAFLQAVTQTGYRRNGAGYDKRSTPPVEFEYTQPNVQEAVHNVNVESLRNLPIGVDGSTYQWTDLHGEGTPGILTEQADAWFYKRNLSPIGNQPVEFAPLELVASKPNLAMAGARAQFMDLAGDGQPDLVVLDGPTPGFYAHDDDEGWQPFRAFTSQLNRNSRDPNMRLVDLDGDGHADVLISEDDALVWHASLGEEGFGPAQRCPTPSDDEKGPRLVFADGTQSVYLADLSGDGLTDLVRICNGEVCYWPNLGYGHFGAKLTMDHAPTVDYPDQFDPKRLRLADIDGSGTTDIIYLHGEGVRLYFNQSGNGWSAPQVLRVFPRVDDVVSIVPTDLFGNGTACLVWSSPLVGDAQRQMRYVDLMGGQKPHLLIRTVNNLGAETHVHYAPSTKFYLQDKRDGKPWITKLPFPVHVVEKVETFDHISRNRFVTRYAYHHGYFDGEEREFRGFGMVEHWDTEQLAALSKSDTFPVGDNVAADSHVPPIHTKTWFHTGIYLGKQHVSDFFAGLLNATDRGEYFREPGLTDAESRALLLPDTVLPQALTLAEEREACRTLKGAMLRQEVYALDASAKAPFPYSVTEQNFSISALQPRGDNRHGVFFTHAREAISYHYERNPADPRVQHALTLEVDAYGNVLKAAAIGYGRRASMRVVDAQQRVQMLPNPGLAMLAAADQQKQTETLVTYTENRVTNAVSTAGAQRNPLPCETRSFELTGYVPSGPGGRFGPSDFVEAEPDNPSPTSRLRHVFRKEFAYEVAATGAQGRRPIEWARSLYRKDDLTGLLPMGQVASLALAGESYKLAFTPGLLAQVFHRPQPGQPAELLLPNPASVLAGRGGDKGGYLQSQTLKADGRFPNTDGDDHWWIASGQSFFSDDQATELAVARQHFFLPRRYRDPFGQDTTISFDQADLLLVETRDAIGNRVSVEANDYRVLQPRQVRDPNGNRTVVVFDVLGMVAGTAVMGKPLPAAVEGDSLVGFLADLTQVQIDAFQDASDPHADASALLKNATTRIVYDLDRFQRSQRANPKDPKKWLPACAATLSRQSHASAALPPQGLKIQIGFSYSDGFGREIQKKIQAEPEKTGGVARGPRWVGSGWTIFNNKGKPVRQYEPFFSTTQRFEFGVRVGVSPVLCYDPAERVVATLQRDHSWGKVVFDAWRQETWDVSDTVLVADPKTDPDVGDFFARLPDADYLPGWNAQRAGGALGTFEQTAARKAAIHANTPAVAHADALGRSFLTVAHNKLKYSDTPADSLPVEQFHSTRIVFGIEGNQRAVIDAKGRVVMRYDHDMLGNRIHQASMEAGERWMLGDVAGKPLLAWDSRNHRFRSSYDALRRPTDSFLQEGAGAELLVARTVYGEARPNAQANNLRGKAVQIFDQAGVVTSDAHDFKGNLLRSQRQLAQAYSTTLNWSVAVPLDAAVYASRTSYDAFNRPVQVIAPHSDQAGAAVNVIQPVYNEANLLEQVNAWLNQGAEPAMLLAPATADLRAVTNIDYDAKGQRTLIEYGNGARTQYVHDPLTFRLTNLLTRRGATELQNLSYTYDPAGNITHIQDAAQPTIFFNKARVEPSADYTYDALYRLIEATGREHLGQIGAAPSPSSYNDSPRVGITFAASDGNAMGRYLERYVYDAVGNFETMKHVGSDPAHAGWQRDYAYGEASLIEVGKPSNRLTRTTTDPLMPEIYSSGGDGYDAHGNMLRMPQLQEMRWDFKDQLRMSRRQKVNDADAEGEQHHGERTWYVYDASGERVRKVTELATGMVKDERIYLGGFEVFRRNGANPLVRETLHLMDDKQRVALVETRASGIEAGVPARLIRFQFGNHLGSASLELDELARTISYEEYTPYGSTSCQGLRSRAKAPRRYRYTGKERDEETGLNYHGARYYASWLGRWVSADPIDINSGLNLFAYVRGNPANLNDPNGMEDAEPKPSASGSWGTALALRLTQRYVGALQGPLPAVASALTSVVIDVAMGRHDSAAENLQAVTDPLVSAVDPFAAARQAKRIVKQVDTALTGAPGDAGAATADLAWSAAETVFSAGIGSVSTTPKVSAASSPKPPSAALTSTMSTPHEPGGSVGAAIDPAYDVAGVLPRGHTVLSNKVGSGIAKRALEPVAATERVPLSEQPLVDARSLVRRTIEGPALDSGSRGYDRRSNKYQEILSTKKWDPYSRQPTDLQLGHIGKPHAMLKPNEKGQLFAQSTKSNNVQSHTEKREVARLKALSDQLGLDPHDPVANPFLFTRPPRARK